MNNSRQRYQNLITLARHEFPHLIQSAKLIDGTFTAPRKMRITLLDHSFLDVWLSFDGDYAYHWEHRAQDGGLHRWDNAPHFPQIASYPHHCHEGSESNVIESHIPQENAEAVLRYILDFIEGQISHRATST